jgi:transposase
VSCFELPQLDACFIKAYRAETTESFLGGHVWAFAFFGGVPISIRGSVTCRRQADG